MSPWHWAIVIGVAMLLFGAKRLPDAARSIGRSARILKAELHSDSDAPAPAPPVAVVTSEPSPAAAPSTAPATAGVAPVVAAPPVQA